MEGPMNVMFIFSFSCGEEMKISVHCCSHGAGLGTVSRRNSQTANKIEIFFKHQEPFASFFFSLSSDFHSDETSKTLVAL